MFDFRMRLAVWVDLKVPQRGVVGVGCSESLKRIAA